MKPVSLRFQCFGPYVQEQFIDFQELEKNGLFLICGETGAGKTTILDAICYALYGRSSGGLRGDISVMRCKLARQDEETRVEYVFDCGGERYQFTRNLKYGRKNLNDSHNCLIWKEGRFVPIFENPKATNVNKKAEELIGLSYDQFRQVIILPQGQFEKLLVSNSEEKEKILVSLFHADRWQRIAEEIYRRVSERDKALNQEKLRISTKLAEYGCETGSQLEEKREAAAGEVELRTENANRIAREMTAAQTNWEQALLANREFEALEKQKQLVLDLEKKQSFYASEEAVLVLAEAAEAIRPQYLACREAKNRKFRAEGNLTEAQRKRQNAQKELETARLQKDTHAERESADKENRQQLLRLENAREVYRSLSEKQENLLTARKAEERARKAFAGAEKQFGDRDADWRRAVQIQEAAIAAWQQAQQGYLLGIGGILAEHLEEGQPCPVCGSREHPAPARVAQGHISEAVLEQKTDAMNDANTAAARALQKRTQAETARKKAEEAFHQARQTAAVAQSAYENALAGKIAGIDSENALEKTIRDLRAAVDSYARRGEEIEETLAACRGTDAAAQAAQQQAAEELTAQEAGCAAQLALWEEALAESGLETEDRFQAADMDPKQRQKRKEALLRYRGDYERARQTLTEQETLLAGKMAPDLQGIREILDQTEQKSREAASGLALAKSRLEAMDADLQDLGKRLTRYEAEREAVNNDMDFANRLRGRSGVSLQRYVLGVMLTSVTAEANRLLANVYSGRYRLYRTDQIAGSARKGGLELEVYDSQNDQRRSVTTLSGGEKFLVALSLAIGLSTVVQAQGGGIRLEAMFIDEGFGSLDREAIGDALEVLQGIRRTAGTVGIISHVEALAESIPAKIEIVKGSRGSRCLMRS